MHLAPLRAYPGIVVTGVRNGLRNNVTSLAAAIAYNAFLAVPASLMVVLGVFTLVERPQDVNGMVDNLDNVVPPEALTLITDTLRRLTESQAGGPLLVVGLLVAMWSVSGALTTLMWALTMTAHGRRDRRSFVRKRLVAVSLFGCALLALATLLVLQVFGPTIVRETGWNLGWLLDALRWPVLICVLFITCSAVMTLAPDGEQREWRALLPGAAFAVVVWLAASEGFAIYVSRFGSYNKAWGSLSGVIVLLVWLWLSGLAILMGGEINAEANRRREEGS